MPERRNEDRNSASVDGTESLGELAHGDSSWYCPAVERVIAEGLCWEYCFAGFGGPADTEAELVEWIERTRAYSDLDNFHAVCEVCEYCQWAR